MNESLAIAHYQLSNAYALKGEKELSINALRKALVLDPSQREQAERDGAFDDIRESPEFQQIIDSTE
jgi:hypothetical protein